MGEQYFYIIHADAGQMQMTTEDPELNTLLNVMNRRKAALTLLDKSFTSIAGDTRLYYPFDYREYTNKRTSSSVMFVHGNKGKHKLERDTSYRSIFLGNKESIIGEKFFDYVFGTHYPSEELLRTGGEDKIIASVQKALEAAENTHVSMDHLNDEGLVCRIAARLLDSQLKNPASRLVLLVPAENIGNRSEELLKQLYTIIPPVLRTEFGFAVNVTKDGIAALILPESQHGCDLPIHIFTMAKTENAEMPEVIGAYPIVYFDTENYLQEEVNEDYLEMWHAIASHLSDTFETEMTFIERLALGNQSSSSFSYLQEEAEQVKNPDTFFYNRDYESIKDLLAAYKSQEDLLKNEKLKTRAVNRFYKNWLAILSKEIVDSIYQGKQEEELVSLNRNFGTKALFDAISSGLNVARQDGAEEQAARDQADIRLAEENLQTEIAYHNADNEQHKKDIYALEETHQTAIQKLDEKHQEDIQRLDCTYQKDLKDEKDKYDLMVAEKNREYDEMVQKFNDYCDKIEKAYKTDTEQLKQDLVRKEVEKEQALEDLNDQWNKKTEQLRAEYADMQDKFSTAEADKKAALDGVEKKYAEEINKLNAIIHADENGLHRTIAGLRNDLEEKEGKIREARRNASELMNQLDDSKANNKDIENKLRCTEEENSNQKEEIKEKAKTIKTLKIAGASVTAAALIIGFVVGFVLIPKKASVKVNLDDQLAGVTYHWQQKTEGGEWTEVPGSTKCLDITAQSGKDTEYRCTLEVPAPKKDDSFSVVSISGLSDNTVYKWERKIGNGDWEEIADENGNSLKVAGSENVQYRCSVVENNDKELTLRVFGPVGDVCYQWQKKVMFGDWTDIEGAITNEVVITTGVDDPADQYRCKIYMGR